MTNVYLETAEPAAPSAPLEGDLATDVVVVGGGFTGLSTALHLAEQGAQVVVLEAEQPGWGASGRNGGQVNPGLKHDPDVVERDFGAALGARMNARAGAAPALVFDLIARHGIRCEARRNGTLRAAVRGNHVVHVRQSFDQLRRRGAPVEFLQGSALHGMTGTHRYSAALWDPRGGDVNPLSYARGLARAACEAGAVVHGGTRAEALQADGLRWRVATRRGTVTAATVVLATNGYTDDLWPQLKRTVVPVFGSIAATGPLPDQLARTIMPSRSVLYESGTITVYYRVDGGGRLLIGGRGPQRDVDSTASVAHLLGYARRLWPALNGIPWTHAWGGRLAMTRDAYPHIHEPARGIITSLGYNGRGIAMATTMGLLIAQRVANPTAEFDMPLTAMAPMRLHFAWPLAVHAAIASGRLKEFVGL